MAGSYLEMTEVGEDLLRVRAQAILIPFVSGAERKRATIALAIGLLGIPGLALAAFVNRNSSTSLLATVLFIALYVGILAGAIQFFRALLRQSISMSEVGVSHITADGACEMVRWGDVIGYEFYTQSPVMRIQKRGRGPIEIVRHPMFNVPSLETFSKIADALDARMTDGATRRRSTDQKVLEPAEWEWEELPAME